MRAFLRGVGLAGTVLVLAGWSAGAVEPGLLRPAVGLADRLCRGRAPLMRAVRCYDEAEWWAWAVAAPSSLERYAEVRRARDALAADYAAGRLDLAAFDARFGAVKRRVLAEVGGSGF